MVNLLYELTEEQKAIRDKAREFAQTRIAAVQEEDEGKRVFRPEIFREMGELGLLGTLIPKEYGGNEGGFLSTILTVEEIGRVCASYCMAPTGQNVGPGLAILRYGTEEQKKK